MAAKSCADRLAAEPRADGHGEEVRKRQDHELQSCQHRREGHGDDGELHPSRRALDRAQHRRQSEQEDRIRQCLGHEVRRVEHRRARDGCSGREQRVRRTDEAARQKVGGQGSRGHEGGVHRLHDSVRGRSRIEEPRRRLGENRQRRREEHGLAADAEPVTRRHALRELRVEELVAEHGRAHVRPRLQPVVGEREHVDPGEDGLGPGSRRGRGTTES